MKNSENGISGNKKMRFSNKTKNGFIKISGHVSPTFDDVSDPPGHRKHLCQLDFFCKLLAAQVVRRSSSCGFLLWTGPNSAFFGYEK
jgi:hypothetical protein